MTTKINNKLVLPFFRTEPEISKPDEFQYIHVTKFTEESAKNFYSDFLKLHSNKEIEIIPIVIDSYGGDVHALMSMLDIMKTSRKPVATIGMGKAMSCGSILLSAGHKGYRYAGKNTEIMVHEVASIAMGKNADVQNDAKVTGRLNNKLLRLLAKNCGKKDRNYFIKLERTSSNVDLYFSASKAKSIGLIDYSVIPELYKA